MSRAIEDLDPDVQAMATGLLATATAEGIVLRITQTFRTAAEQQALYDQGRTTPGSVVTNSPPGYSFHEFRRAFDVCIATYEGDKTPENAYDGPWEHVGALGEAQGLDWGGRWKHPDRPHFEHHGGKTLAQWRQAREAWA